MMGGHTSKNEYVPNGEGYPEEHIEYAERIFLDETREFEEEMKDLTVKLELGVSFTEWISTYVKENEKKAQQLVLLAVQLAEQIEPHIIAAVTDGVLHIGVWHHLLFFILISYIQQYTGKYQVGTRFKIKFKVTEKHPYPVDVGITESGARAIIKSFRRDGIVEPMPNRPTWFYLAWRTAVQDENFLGYRLPGYMVKIKQMASVGLI